MEEIVEETEDIQILKTDGTKEVILFLAFFPPVKRGDLVKINCTATQLKLGTGGYDFVVNVESSHQSCSGNKQGHIIKGRYLPIQHSMLTIESPEQNRRDFLQKRLDLREKSVLLCELHSMLPALWELYKSRRRNGKLVAIIDDSAALALPVSRHLQRLHQFDDFISISIGQAFGGKVEAINLITALQYAKEKYPEALFVVTVGPGVVGSGTRYGFSGVSQAEWANIIGKFNGVPVWVPRLSGGDTRQRHFGLSHHTKTALTELTYAYSILPMPQGPLSDSSIKNVTEDFSCYEHIHLTLVSEDEILPWLQEVFSDSPAIRSMGRGFDEDRLFFIGVGTALHWMMNVI